jgi:YHYH protein
MTPCPRLLTPLPFATCLAVLLSTVIATAETQTPQSTAEAVTSAKWADTVTITPDGTTFRYVSDGLPNHALAEAYLVPLGQEQPFTEFEVKPTKSFVVATPIDVTIPLVPVYSDTATDTSLGMIGVMISGARLFNDYENPERSIVAMDDQQTQDGASFLDTCNGHPLQNGSSYHYHASPPCVTETVDGSDTHSAMIGILLDGFPIYGPQDEGGRIVQNSDLDECSGHVGPTPEFPDGIYHYHLTTEEAPYSIDCYHGEVDPSLANAMDGPGGPPNFAAVAEKLGVDQHALMDALGAERPPNFERAAAELGISVEALRDAMPPPPGGP